MEVRIVGTGVSLPGLPRSNAELLHYANLDTTEEWIQAKIGIKTRHTCLKVPEEGKFDVDDMHAEKGCHNSDLCKEAAEKALEMAELSIDDVDMIIISTCTPDYPVPSTASIVADKLGITECAVMDIRSACSGSVQGIVTAYNYLRSGYYKTIIVIGSETGTLFGNLDKSQKCSTRGDMVSAVMIGDGAGACIMRSFSPEETPAGIEIIYSTINCMGKGKAPGMWLPAGGSCQPFNRKVLEQGLHYFKHDYRAVFAHGADLYWRGLTDALKALQLTISDFDLFIPHQANGKITENAVKLGLPEERIYHNFEEVGNTANACLFIALDDIVRSNRLPANALAMFVQAESTKWLYGTIVMRWQPLVSANASGARKKTATKVRSTALERIRARAVVAGLGTLLWLRSGTGTPSQSLLLVLTLLVAFCAVVVGYVLALYQSS